jgi:acyl-CoA synthetase (AMP-forming)/AMP-acid ligase II
MPDRQLVAGRFSNVVELLREAAQRHGDTEAYVEPEVGGSPRVALSFGAWDRAADGVAGLLAQHGVGRGDVVCLLLPSSVDFAVVYAAALRLGAITSAINPRLGRVELESVVACSAPVVTVVDPELGLTLPPGSGRTLTRAETVAARDGAPPRLPELDEHDPVAVVWTSGTSGRPKGAVFDHANLAAVAAGTDILSAPGDRRLSPLPFAHVGYMTRIWGEIANAITTVITPTPWRAAEALSIMSGERITVGQGVPTQWALVLALEELATTDLSALRIAGTGAARMPAEQVREMRARLGVPVVVRYTSTETSLGTGTLPDDPVEVVATTVGRPVPGVELAITDESGQPVPVGEVGRVRLRSGAAMRGYWCDAAEQEKPRPRGTAGLVDPVASAPVLVEGGWVVTGDFGSLDPAGNLVLSGRDSERYIRGGYNVFPAEVEEALRTHPGVGEVAVVGAPDPVLGEVGVAFVVPAGDEGEGTVLDLEELRMHCRQQLSDYKSPDALVVLGSLPLTALIKIDKPALEGPARDAADQRMASRRDPSATATGAMARQEEERT